MDRAATAAAKVGGRGFFNLQLSGNVDASEQLGRVSYRVCVLKLPRIMYEEETGEEGRSKRERGKRVSKDNESATPTRDNRPSSNSVDVIVAWRAGTIIANGTLIPPYNPSDSPQHREADKAKR